MMDPQLFLEKMASGTATPEERLAFERWLDSLDEERYLAVMAEYEAFLESWPGPAMAATEEGDPIVLESIHNRLMAMHALRETATAPIGRLHRMIAYSAAAAILVLAVVGVYLVVHHSKPPSGMATGILADRLPGGAKATLTLGDGAVLALDSASKSNTHLQQGLTDILRDKGKLTYRPQANDETIADTNTVATPAGGRYFIVLPDRTKVWLNAESSIRFPTVFNGATRSVRVTGEAYFEVAANARQPFVVRTTRATVQVLGTSFDLMAYDDEPLLKTTLVSGAIKVTNNKEATVNKDAIVLAPGQQGIVNKADLTLTVAKANVRDETAWKDGFFRFHDVPLEEIMRPIARWYNIRVRYEGNIAASRFSAAISSNNNLSRVLQLLENGGLHFQLTNDLLTLYE